MTRTEVAERIARQTAKSVREARAAGYVNTMGRMAYMETAEVWGYAGDKDYSMRTVERVARKTYTETGEVKK